VATAFGVVAGSLAVWAGTWIWHFLDPSLDGLAHADVAEVAVPGADTAALESGPHTIYHDIDGCDAGPEGCEPPQVTVWPANGEPPIVLRPTGSSHDTILGVGVYTLDIDDPGDYRIEVAGEPASVTLARGPLFDPGPGWQFALKVVGGPILFIASLFAAPYIIGQEAERAAA
jgi:hypothetical protein